MQKPHVIFMDLDGVLVDLHRALVPLFGDNPQQYRDEDWAKVGHWGLSIPKENFWARVRSQGIAWWANLPKLPWTDELWEAALKTGADCVVLTTPAPFAESAAGKWQWVQENLHTTRMLIGQPKEVCSRQGHLLIDDRAGYQERWEAAGGQILSLKRPWNPDGIEIEKIIAQLRSWAQ